MQFVWENVSDTHFVAENYMTDDGFLFCFWCCCNLFPIYDLCSSLHFLSFHYNSHDTRWGFTQRYWDPMWNASNGSGVFLCSFTLKLWKFSTTYGLLKFCACYRHTRQMLSALININLSQRNFIRITFLRVKHILVVTWNALKVVFLELTFQRVLSLIQQPMGQVIFICLIFYRTLEALSL